MIFLSRIQSFSGFDSLSHTSLISLSQQVQILRRLQKTSQLKMAKAMDKLKSSKIAVS